LKLEQIHVLLQIFSGVAALGAGLVTGLWAYTKFILERALLPPAQFDAVCTTVGLQEDKVVLEVTLHLKNLGTSALVANNIRLDLLYLDASDPISLFTDPVKLGRLRFPHSLFKELHGKKNSDASSARSSLAEREQMRSEAVAQERGICILGHKTFVQPGVDQVYAFATTIPASARYALVWASFNYAQKAGPFQRAALWISRRLGLIQYSLTRVTKPHTIERAFRVAAPDPAGTRNGPDKLLPQATHP
jgi:hypothetical protein